MATSRFMGRGDVVGPASATDGALCAFDGTTGKLIKVGSGLSPTFATVTATVSFVTGTTTIGPSTATFGTSISIPNGGGFFWSSRAYVASPADSVVSIGNNNATTGVRLNTSTDGTLRVLAFAGADTATVQASAFKVGTKAGVSFSGAVTNITVVNGIVTAAS